MDERNKGQQRARIVIRIESPQFASRAASLAQSLSLPILPESAPAPDDASVILNVGSRLTLSDPSRPKQSPVFLDVRSRAFDRRLSSGIRRSSLARAVGLPRRRPTVLDATAGLGRDSFQLAALGLSVIAVEREPVVAALLEDAVADAIAFGGSIAAAASRITLVAADAREYLKSLSEAERPDVMYLDPMFSPGARGTADVKKEMAIFRRLFNDAKSPETFDASEDESLALFRAAMASARDRVVVKRQRTAPPLSSSPSAEFSGSRVRFDMYLT